MSILRASVLVALPPSCAIMLCACVSAPSGTTRSLPVLDGYLATPKAFGEEVRFTSGFGGYEYNPSRPVFDVGRLWREDVKESKGESRRGSTTSNGSAKPVAITAQEAREMAAWFVERCFGSLGNGVSLAASPCRLTKGENAVYNGFWVDFDESYRGVPTDLGAIVSLTLRGKLRSVDSWLGVLEPRAGSEMAIITADSAIDEVRKMVLAQPDTTRRKENMEMLAEMHPVLEYRRVYGETDTSEKESRVQVVLRPVWVLRDPLVVDAHTGRVRWND